MAMKAIFFVLICALLAGFLLFGCTATSTQDIAKKNSVLKKFLTKHPGAKFVFIEYDSSEFVLKKSFWEDYCRKGLAEQDYYLALADDKDAKLAVLFEKGQLQVICAVQINKTGFVPLNNNSVPQTPDAPGSDPQGDINQPPGNITPPADENVPEPPAPEPPAPEPPVIEPPCEEFWACTDWSDCNSGKQSRQCFELESCPEDTNAPQIQKSC